MKLLMMLMEPTPFFWEIMAIIIKIAPCGSITKKWNTEKWNARNTEKCFDSEVLEKKMLETNSLRNSKNPDFWESFKSLDMPNKTANA